MSKERSGRVAAPEPARNCRPPKPLGGLLPGACSVVDRHAEFYSRGGLRSLLDAAPGAIAVGPCARLARRRRPWRRWRRARIHCATMPTGLWLARYRRPRPHKYAVVKISHGSSHTFSARSIRPRRPNVPTFAVWSTGRTPASNPCQGALGGPPHMYLRSPIWTYRLSIGIVHPHSSRKPLSSSTPALLPDLV